MGTVSHCTITARFYQHYVCLVNEKLLAMTVIVRKVNDKWSQLAERANKAVGCSFPQRLEQIINKEDIIDAAIKDCCVMLIGGVTNASLASTLRTERPRNFEPTEWVKDLRKG